MSRILVVSDLHCGHHSGLTPPEYQYQEGKDVRWNKWANIQRQSFDWFIKTVKELSPIDLVIANGDMIEGTGRRSGGTELISTDCLVQVKIAEICLSCIKGRRYYFTYGTPYHTGEASDYEELIAEAFKGPIGSHDWISLYGKQIDIKHHINPTQSPQGLFTGLLREAWANDAWAARKEQPKSDILIRSHVHKYACGEAIIGDRLVTFCTTPALQGYGSKYGSRRCFQTVDFGMIAIDITRKGYSVKPLIPRLPCWRAT